MALLRSWMNQSKSSIIRLQQSFKLFGLDIALESSAPEDSQKLSNQMGNYMYYEQASDSKIFIQKLRID